MAFTCCNIKTWSSLAMPRCTTPAPGLANLMESLSWKMEIILRAKEDRLCVPGCILVWSLGVRTLLPRHRSVNSASALMEQINCVKCFHSSLVQFENCSLLNRFWKCLDKTSAASPSTRSWEFSWSFPADALNTSLNSGCIVHVSWMEGKYRVLKDDPVLTDR